MHLLRALMIQAVSWAVALFALRYTVSQPPGLTVIAIMQGGIAGGLALAMRLPRWWIVIHLLFSPMLIWARMLSLPPWVYLACFTLMALVFWSTFRSRVPLFMTNRATARTLLRLLPRERAVSLVDLGCGTGSLLRFLAQSRPDCRFVGVENAPLPYLIARWRARALSNCEIRRQDLWSVPLADFDFAYAFLSPVPMPKLARKAALELDAHTLFISNSFPMPGLHPVREIEARRGTRTLYLYRFDGRRQHAEKAGKAPSHSPGSLHLATE